MLSADILLPKPQVGHAKSLIVSAEDSELWRQADLSRHLQSQNSYVDQKQKVISTSRSHLGEKLIVGLVEVGPNMIYSSLTDAVTSIWR